MITRVLIRRTPKGFHRDEDGAVTVDWIALTAALVLMGIAVTFFIGSAVPELADSTSNYMTGFDVGGDPSDL